MSDRLPPARQSTARSRGAAGEAQALVFLQQQGLLLIEKNYSCRWGEIDLIMRERLALVFVEVRQRSSQHFGGAAASVTAAKQGRLWRTAQHYLQAYASPPACRFDLLAIDGQDIQWLKNILSL